jgi:uncharacterized damage-inducible protein DinB
MDGSQVIRRLHEHRMWVDDRLLAAVQPLTADELHRQFPIGQGSIWRTLTHTVAAEYVWLEALLGDENPLFVGDVRGKLPGNQAGEGALTSLDELAATWQALHARWKAYLTELRDESLDEIVYKVSTSSGFGHRLATKRADVLLHVCTHAQYTTAQLVNMLRQLGREQLPDVMLVTMARHEAAALLGGTPCVRPSRASGSNDEGRGVRAEFD